MRGAVIPLVLLTLWQLGSRSGVLPIDSCSRPSAIVLAFVQGIADGTIPIATWQTLEAALAGFAIATVVGILCGVVLGLSPRLEEVVGPSIDALRPVPSVALIPLALLVFGFGLRMEACVVAFACLWPVLLMTIAAVRGIERRLLEVARSLELSFWQQLAKIILPAAAPRIVIGLRLAIAISLVVAVTVEIVLNPRGLGYSMISAQQALRSDLMYAQLLWLGLLGWLINKVIR
jgi:ABC-type nitrate/sulfonate/bicarbonate transport system permease component